MSKLQKIGKITQQIYQNYKQIFENFKNIPKIQNECKIT